MTPQMFYPIENNITVKFGDILVRILSMYLYYCITARSLIIDDLK